MREETRTYAQGKRRERDESGGESRRLVKPWGIYDMVDAPTKVEGCKYYIHERIYVTIRYYGLESPIYYIYHTPSYPVFYHPIDWAVNCRKEGPCV